MWHKLRVAVLLITLLAVINTSLIRDGRPDWKRNLYVALYPINMDDSAIASKAIADLNQEQFDEISDYFSQESSRLSFHIAKPFEVRLGSPVIQKPPQPQVHGNVLMTMLWSLQFRWWAHQHKPTMLVPPDVTLYLLYFDPATHKVLPHSTALSKGRIGLVNVFASAQYTQQNNVVIAHELLHTVGATDKYDLNNLQPRLPDGYVDPQQIPLYPQHLAELMAGRRPITSQKSEIPLSLAQTLLGAMTEKEIGWIK